MLRETRFKNKVFTKRGQIQNPVYFQRTFFNKFQPAINYALLFKYKKNTLNFLEEIELSSSKHSGKQNRIVPVSLTARPDNKEPLYMY